MSVELSHLTIGMLDGGAVGMMIDAELRNALIDLDDRGDDGKPRKVVVTVTLTKDRNVTDVLVDAKATLPPRKSNRTVASLEASGRMTSAFFSPDSPGNPKQQTLPVEGE